MDAVMRDTQLKVFASSTGHGNPKLRRLSHQSTLLLHRSLSRLRRGRSSSWSTESQRRIYSAKLVEEFRKSRRLALAPASLRSRQVREMADRMLATAAKGNTRWSRAILTGLTTRRFEKAKKKVSGERRGKRRELRMPVVKRRMQVLGRLVPGCRKVSSLTSLLEEATDYISALEMQVKAMTSLAEILSTSSSPAAKASGAQ